MKYSRTSMKLWIMNNAVISIITLLNLLNSQMVFAQSDRPGHEPSEVSSRYVQLGQYSSSDLTNEKGHSNSENRAISRDGSRVAFTLGRDQVRVIDTFAMLHNRDFDLSGHNADGDHKYNVLEIGLSNDGSLLFILARNDENVVFRSFHFFVYEIDRGKLLVEIPINTRSVNPFAFSPDGRFVAFAPIDHLYVFQIDSLKKGDKRPFASINLDEYSTGDIIETSRVHENGVYAGDFPVASSSNSYNGTFQFGWAHPHMQFSEDNSSLAVWSQAVDGGNRWLEAIKFIVADDGVSKDVGPIKVSEMFFDRKQTRFLEGHLMIRGRTYLPKEYNNHAYPASPYAFRELPLIDEVAEGQDGGSYHYQYHREHRRNDLTLESDKKEDIRYRFGVIERKLTSSETFNDVFSRFEPRSQDWQLTPRAKAFIFSSEGPIVYDLATSEAHNLGQEHRFRHILSTVGAQVVVAFNGDNIWGWRRLSDEEMEHNARVRAAYERFPSEYVTKCFGSGGTILEDDQQCRCGQTHFDPYYYYCEDEEIKKRQND